VAVLSEPTADLKSSPDQFCAVLGADSPALRRRIKAALERPGQDDALIFVGGTDELIDLGLEAPAIALLVCDLDRSAEMATLRRVRRGLSAVSIVALSPLATATSVRRGLDAGADAIVLEPMIESTLAVTVKAVGSGQAVVPRELRATVQPPALSHREQQVLTYVTEGLTNAQIAAALFLSESTVKSHLSSAFAKFGVGSRREAAALFLELDRRQR
jgi:DNA-binding NarL/FixJ family response regulator